MNELSGSFTSRRKRNRSQLNRSNAAYRAAGQQRGVHCLALERGQLLTD